MEIDTCGSSLIAEYLDRKDLKEFRFDFGSRQ